LTQSAGFAEIGLLALDIAWKTKAPHISLNTRELCKLADNDRDSYQMDIGNHSDSSLVVFLLV
jgi:hypothetical protein